MPPCGEKHKDARCVICYLIAFIYNELWHIHKKYKTPKKNWQRLRQPDTSAKRHPASRLTHYTPTRRKQGTQSNTSSSAQNDTLTQACSLTPAAAGTGDFSNSPQFSVRACGLPFMEGGFLQTRPENNIYFSLAVRKVVVGTLDRVWARKQPLLENMGGGWGQVGRACPGAHAS